MSIACLQLRGLPAELYTGPMSHLCNPAPAPCLPPPLPPAEIKRQRIYSQLSALGSAIVPALIAALDSVSRTGALAAQAIGNIGAPGAAAVPALVKLLSSEDEALRNDACIGLGGIGPLVKSALPQLKRALADPSINVRGFARLAIAQIDASVPP
jgi:HEAT repeat protein